MTAIVILRYRVPLDAVRTGDPFWKRGIANHELLPWNPVPGREGLDAI